MLRKCYFWQKLRWICHLNQRLMDSDHKKSYTFDQDKGKHTQNPKPPVHGHSGLFSPWYVAVIIERSCTPSTYCSHSLLCKGFFQGHISKYPKSTSSFVWGGMRVKWKQTELTLSCNLWCQVKPIYLTFAFPTNLTQLSHPHIHTNQHDILILRLRPIPCENRDK